MTLEKRLQKLATRGVTVVDPRQTYLGADVELDRIHDGVILHPGTRITGARSFFGKGAELGREGPATVHNAVLGEQAAVASGYVDGAVLLAGAKVGANAHLRPGTLLEEQASTAHAVGLKHTILLPFVTLGSLINFCDCLMAGGRSRQDHSEVGSGFIHFNYTPWGERGDKATPSLLGDVPSGVFLKEDRIFLGGSGGLAGPRSVGYGSVAGAGQVLRRDVGEKRLVLTESRALDVPMRSGELGGCDKRSRKNVYYIAQLVALRAWYQGIRLPQCEDQDLRRPVYEAAIDTLGLCIEERIRQLARFRQEREAASLHFTWGKLEACPLAGEDVQAMDYLQWIASLEEGTTRRLRAWLEGIVAQV